MNRELEAALHRAGQCETLRLDSFQRYVPGPQLPMCKLAGPRIFPKSHTDFPAYLRSGHGRSKCRALEPEPPQKRLPAAAVHDDSNMVGKLGAVGVAHRGVDHV